MSETKVAEKAVEKAKYTKVLVNACADGNVILYHLTAAGQNPERFRVQYEPYSRGFGSTMGVSGEFVQGLLGDTKKRDELLKAVEHYLPMADAGGFLLEQKLPVQAGFALFIGADGKQVQANLQLSDLLFSVGMGMRRQSVTVKVGDKSISGVCAAICTADGKSWVKVPKLAEAKLPKFSLDGSDKPVAPTAAPVDISLD